jgi:MFS family permease
MAGGGVVSVIAGGVLGDISWRHPYLVYGWPILLVPFVLAFVNEPQVKRLEKSASSPATTFPYGPVALVYAVTFAGMLAFYCMPVQTPYIFKAIGEDRPSIAGLGGATGVSSSIIAALMLPLIARLIGNARLLGLTFSLLATGLVVVGLAETVQQIIAGMLIAGLGGGLLVPNVALWLNGIVDETVRGRANGGLSSAIFFSQFANPLIFLPLASATGGLGNALVVLGGLIALVAIIAIFSSRGKRAEEAAPARALV